MRVFFFFFLRNRKVKTRWKGKCESAGRLEQQVEPKLMDLKGGGKILWEASSTWGAGVGSMEGCVDALGHGFYDVFNVALRTLRMKRERCSHHSHGSPMVTAGAQKE